MLEQPIVDSIGIEWWIAGIGLGCMIFLLTVFMFITKPAPEEYNCHTDTECYQECIAKGNKLNQCE